jgi:predicted small secreted protein
MNAFIQSLLRSVSVIATVTLIVVGLSACNTVGGIGRDLESAGEAIEDAAD